MTYREILSYMGVPATEKNLRTLGDRVIGHQGNRAVDFPDKDTVFSAWVVDWRERAEKCEWQGMEVKHSDTKRTQ